MGSFKAGHNIIPLQKGQTLKSFALYETAKNALAECVSLIDAEQVIDMAEAVIAFTKIAKDLSLELNAVKLRIDAERKLGQFIKAQKETVGLHKGGKPRLTGSDTEPVTSPVKLADVGIDKKQSSRAQKYADLSEEQFNEQKEQLEQKAEKTGRVPKHLPCAAEKSRKKTHVIEHKEEAEMAEFESSDAELLASNDETFQTLYEQEAAENAEKSEIIHQLEAKVKVLEAKLAAYEENASQAINAETAQKIATLEAKVEALERDNKALTTQRDHFQSEFADRQSKLNWWKEEYKKVCKATGYERPKKTSTYCTGTGYSDPNDPRAKPLPPMEGAPKKDLAQSLAEEKAAVNQQKKEANQWLEQNNLPADDGYQFSGKQAAAQATRERFADNRPKPAPAEAPPERSPYDYYNPLPHEAINGWGDLAK